MGYEAKKFWQNSKNFLGKFLKTFGEIPKNIWRNS